MIANWFAVSGGGGSRILKSALKILGLECHLEIIDKTLDTRIGETTFRSLVKDFRNAQATHEIFKGDVQVKICEKYSLEPAETSNLLQKFLNEMYEHIVDLQVRLELAFYNEQPQLYSIMRSTEMFISVRGLRPQI